MSRKNSITKVALAVVAGLVVTALIGYFTLIVSKTSLPEDCEFALDLPAMRALARSIPGDLPQEIRVEELGGGEPPLAIVSAGQPWTTVSMRVYAYQIVFADKTIVIDTAMSPAQATERGYGGTYDAQAWERLQRAMRNASAVYFTHEHDDHMGGAFANSADTLANVHLTREQLTSEAPYMPKISAAARETLQPLDYERMTAVAPGIVLLKARGHTVGSQMVFVTKADGTEVLLTGDTAWLMKNIETEQGPPRLVALMMKSDRRGSACQLHALHEAAASLGIMPGHDPGQMKALTEKGVFATRFQ